MTLLIVSVPQDVVTCEDKPPRYIPRYTTPATSQTTTFWPAVPTGADPPGGSCLVVHHPWHGVLPHVMACSPGTGRLMVALLVLSRGCGRAAAPGDAGPVPPPPGSALGGPHDSCRRPAVRLPRLVGPCSSIGARPCILAPTSVTAGELQARQVTKPPWPREACWLDASGCHCPSAALQTPPWTAALQAWFCCCSVAGPAECAVHNGVYCVQPAACRLQHRHAMLMSRQGSDPMPMT